MKIHEAAAAMTQFVDSAAAAAGTIDVRVTAALLANSIGLGMVFALVTFVARRRNELVDDRANALQGASNLLFLCVGLTGTMVLINNNMVRAFAIGAAIALVRFRIKLDGKSANASLLFAILAGISCGLTEVAMAWTLLGTYVLLVALLALVGRVLLGGKPDVAASPATPVTPPTPLAASAVPETSPVSCPMPAFSSPRL